MGHNQAPGHNVLTLDLATRTGWCEGHLGDVPRFGVLRLSDATIAGRCCALEDWLWARLEGPDPPKEVIFEAPLPRTDSLGINAGRLGMGLVTIVECACFRRGVDCFESSVATTRKEIIGRGTFKKGEAKLAVHNWCQENGWDPPDDNAADALVLWFHTLRVRRPGAPLPRGPRSGAAFLVSARRHLGGSE